MEREERLLARSCESIASATASQLRERQVGMGTKYTRWEDRPFTISTRWVTLKYDMSIVLQQRGELRPWPWRSVARIAITIGQQ